MPARPNDGSTAGGTSRAVDVAIVRRANTEHVVRLLREAGPLSRADIARRAGLTRPTIFAIVTELLAAGTLVEAGAARRATPGRPGSLLAFNSRARLTAAFRLRPEAVEAVVADADGEILAETSAPFGARTPGAMLRTAADTVLELADGVEGADRLGAVGVLLPGSVDAASGVCRFSAPLGWRDVPVAAPLETRLGAPVVVLNPAHAFGLAEATVGAGQGRRNVVAILLDWGIGAGIVSDGRLVTGAGGRAGEIGHTRVVENGIRCECGRLGCLETVASGREIVAAARRILGPATPERPRLADLEGRAAELDAVLDHAAGHLGVAAGWLINALAPEVVVLTGSTFIAGARRFFEVFRREALRASLPSGDVDVVPSPLDERGDLRAALRAACERLPATFAPQSPLLPSVGEAA